MPKHKNPTSLREMVDFTDIRDAVSSSLPVDHLKTDAEHVVAAMMPGDEVESHPMYVPFNRWANKPPTVIRRMLEAGEVPVDEIEWAKIALKQWGPSSR